MTNDLHDVANIMGIGEDAVQVLPQIQFEGNLLNCWGSELPGLFRPLHLSPGQTVLDIPCGQGGVSVYLAEEYGVHAEGYDLLQGFVDRADQYAKERHVEGLCRFAVRDIREVVGQGRTYDVVLWFAPPHLWENTKQTVGQLRQCAKPGGYIVMADAYVYTDTYKSRQPDYETLPEIMQGAAAYGDSILHSVDYKGALWADSYRADRQALLRAVDRAGSPKDKEALESYLRELNESEVSDVECLGLYALVLQVDK